MLGVNSVHTRNLLILKHNLFSMKVNTGHETSGQQSSQINYSIRQRQFKEGNYPPHYHVLMMCVNNSIYAMKSSTGQHHQGVMSQQPNDSFCYSI